MGVTTLYLAALALLLWIINTALLSASSFVSWFLSQSCKGETDSKYTDFSNDLKTPHLKRIHTANFNHQLRSPMSWILFVSQIPACFLHCPCPAYMHGTNLSEINSHRRVIKRTIFTTTNKKLQMYLIVDESCHRFDLQHVGFVGPELMNKTVCSPVVPMETHKVRTITCLSTLPMLCSHHGIQQKTDCVNQVTIEIGHFCWNDKYSWLEAVTW